MNQINKMKDSIKFLGFLLAIVVMTSCADESKYKIEKGKVGPIDETTMMKDLDNLFPKDSIVERLGEGATGDTYFADDDEYLIYEKGGKLLLTVVPNETLDSLSTIKSVEIHDARFKTESGITLDSNFSEINANNKLRPESTLQSVTLFVDELNATITIDKSELGLSNFNSQKISLEQIPDLAKIKSFVVWFN